MSAFTVTTQKIVKHEATLDRTQLIHLMREAGYTNVPDDAKITMNVPGGGDYSNTTLDIDEMPIHIEYTTVE